MKKEFRLRIIALLSLLTIPLLGLIYVFLNHPGGGAFSLVTDLDKQIPFVKAFVLPYLAWFPFLLLAFVYLAFKDRKLFYRTLVQFNIGLLICYGIYAVYQTYVPRPMLEGHDWLTRMVQSVYNADEPYNCFPSTHVLTSYIMMKAFLGGANIPRLYKGAVTFMAILIIASTQFMKQHVLLDIVGAVLVAEGILLLVSWMPSEWVRKPISSTTRMDEADRLPATDPSR